MSRVYLKFGLIDWRKVGAIVLRYWKNTMFYSSGKDDDFLLASKEIFLGKIWVNKSIAYLEGVL